ncbi:hypothetical protein NC652_019977 [Populus alba x Populus x berolinensis]|nr:hypothetical protein NC652_019977 [Populus alba x Populus x berolinensis]
MAVLPHPEEVYSPRSTQFMEGTVELACFLLPDLFADP